MGWHLHTLVNAVSAFSGLECWNGVLEWNHWNGVKHWSGPVGHFSVINFILIGEYKEGLKP